MLITQALRPAALLRLTQNRHTHFVLTTTYAQALVSPICPSICAGNSYWGRRNFVKTCISRDKPLLDVQSGPRIAFQPPPRPPFWHSFGFKLVIGLIVGGTAVVSTFYVARDAFSIWPKELREDLRAAVQAKHRKDYKASAAYFHRAYNTAKDMPLEQLGPEPYLKLTGIAIALGEVAELQNDVGYAFWAYINAYRILLTPEREAAFNIDFSNIVHALAEVFGDSPQNIPGTGHAERTASENLYRLNYAERLRLIALAMRLSELVDFEPQRSEYANVNAKRTFLSRAAFTTARLLVDEEKYGKQDASSTYETAQWDLPNWTRHTNLMAPLEAYAKQLSNEKYYDAARHIYGFIARYYTVRLLKGLQPTCHHCEFAEVLNGFSHCILESYLLSIDEKLARAEYMLDMGRKTAMDALSRSKTGDDFSQCEGVLPVILVNLGTVQEMGSKLELAQSSFTNALAGAKVLGLQECAEAAQEGLSRVTGLQAEKKSQDIKVDAISDTKADDK